MTYHIKFFGLLGDISEGIAIDHPSSVDVMTLKRLIAEHLTLRKPGH